MWVSEPTMNWSSNRQNSTHQPVAGGVRRSRRDTCEQGATRIGATCVGCTRVGAARSLVILHKQAVYTPGVPLNLGHCDYHLRGVPEGGGVLSLLI